MIGNIVPENNKAWDILLDLKDIVELVTATKLSEESLCFLDCKVSEHRQLFQEVFPEERLKPKHHFIEHYAHLIRCFGPLVETWTMRFESKHSYFKTIVRDCHNSKNRLKTLASQHHLMFSSFFFLSSALEPNLKAAIETKFGHQNTVSLATTVCLQGITYQKGTIVSFGGMFWFT